MVTVFVKVLATLGILSLSLAAGAGAQSLAAAVLPSSRSVLVGTSATAFGTIINLESGTAVSCGISAAPPSGTFHFQTTNCATNLLTGTPDTPVNIPGGGMACFVFAFTPTGAFSPTDVALTFDCSNTAPAPNTLGLTTLLRSASITPIPDIVALAATLNNDGIVNILGTNGTGVFSVATVNVGVGGSMTVSADTGSFGLPVSLTVCETNPTTGSCVAPPASSVSTTIGVQATPTFGVFVTGIGAVPFAPATNRVFVRFRDTGGAVRGATSVAVRTQLMVPDIRGIFSGSAIATQTQCTNSANNGTFGFSAVANISNQAGESFSGSAVLTTVIAGSNIVDQATLSGAVTAQGQVNGTFSFISTVDGSFSGSGDGSFSGALVDNTLALSFSGRIRVGEGCLITGTFTGKR